MPNLKNSIFGIFVTLHTTRYCFIFLLAFLGAINIVEETSDIFGILRKLWGRSMCFFMQKILIQNFDLIGPGFDLTSVESQAG